MSRASALRLLVVIAVLPSFGCWEQWSVDWWPQMKWQLAVQAYEDTETAVAPGGFVPPEGTVPIGAVRRTSTMQPAETEALQNPVPVSLASLDNGKKQFEIFCGPCHGAKGMADGPVAKAFLGVLPLVVSQGRTDGHLYATIGYGRRRMPAYGRITLQDRWDIVNYVRYMNGQLPGAQTAQAAPAAMPQQGGAQQ